MFRSSLGLEILLKIRTEKEVFSFAWLLENWALCIAYNDNFLQRIQSAFCTYNSCHLIAHCLVKYVPYFKLDINKICISMKYGVKCHVYTIRYILWIYHRSSNFDITIESILLIQAFNFWLNSRLLVKWQP